MTVPIFLKRLFVAWTRTRDAFRPRHTEAVCLSLLQDIEASGGGIPDSDPRTETELFLSAMGHGLVDGSAWGAAFHLTSKGRRLLSGRR